MSGERPGNQTARTAAAQRSPDGEGDRWEFRPVSYGRGLEVALLVAGTAWLLAHLLLLGCNALFARGCTF